MRGVRRKTSEANEVERETDAAKATLEPSSLSKRRITPTPV